jgi:D-alanyl-D-alanine carboxypeptidase (penicillin-binding protein 5/6)
VSVVLIDFETGALLFSQNPNEEIPPASLTKLMTMHIMMNEIEAGKASYDDLVPITNESWAANFDRRATVMALEPRHIVNVREIMLGLAIISGNDAAVAAALKFAPSVDAFAEMMTAEARAMGLKVTRFVEPSGLSEYNMTTAEEFLFFCRRYLQQHPNSIRDFHSVPVFNYPEARNVPPSLRSSVRTIAQYNRNDLIRSFTGVDGLKPGYIDDSGYNIALTAERDGTRFLAVILGAPSARARDTDGRHLLTWAFDTFKTVRPQINEVENARLWKGREDDVELKLAHTPDFTAPASRAANLFYQAVIEEPLVAPLSAGAFVGYLVISDDRGELNRVPLLTARSYEKGGFFKRLWHSIKLLFVK